MCFKRHFVSYFVVKPDILSKIAICKLYLEKFLAWTSLNLTIQQKQVFSHRCSRHSRSTPVHGYSRRHPGNSIIFQYNTYS